MTNEFRKMAQDFARLRVLVIGDVILDSYSIGSARRLCQEAPVPVIDDCRRHNYPGGAANVAANLRALGATPVLISAIGCDHEGDLLRQELRSADVETSGLFRLANRQTLTKHRVVCGNQILVRADQGTTSEIDKQVALRLAEQLTAEFERCDAV